ncbi:hypothetical protein OQA88_3560 [Cercophora sp. LCS_1]
MAPIRRYLRITKYSVLEVRIYLENPALTQSWLLNPRDPILPKVIQSVRPLVLPKLREEQERERSNKKNKKKSIKDVVVEDDFEVSIFLTGTDTRHSILHKTRIFRDKTQTKLTSNSSKLTGGDSLDAAIDVDAHVPDVSVLAEDDDEPIALDSIPVVDETATASRPKRRRQSTAQVDPGSEAEEPVFQTVSDSSDDELFVHDSDSDGPPPPKRRRDKGKDKGKDKEGETQPDDEKKKMSVDISYEGFAIYGRVLCLVIKRRGAKALTGGSRPLTGRPGGQAVMENWITSTQLPEAGGEDEAT